MLGNFGCSALTKQQTTDWNALMRFVARLDLDSPLEKRADAEEIALIHKVFSQTEGGVEGLLAKTRAEFSDIRDEMLRLAYRACNLHRAYRHFSRITVSDSANAVNSQPANDKQEERQNQNVETLQS